MKQNKYRRVKKTLIAGASSGIVAGMIIMGVSGNTAFAQTQENSPPAFTQDANIKGMHMMRRWNSPAKAGSLAGSLGLDKAEISQELKAGKTMKQILQEHDIVPGEIQKAFEAKKSMNKRMWKQMKSPKPNVKIHYQG